MFGLTQKDRSATNTSISGTISVSHATIETATVGTVTTSAEGLTVGGLNVYQSTGVYSVLSLPPAANNVGRLLVVNDSNLPAATNFGEAVGAGGANFVPVYSDGTIWRIG